MVDRDVVGQTRPLELRPDGAPHQAVIWYRFEGDHIVVNSAIGRRWPANLLRDPRVSVAVIDRHDGLRWVGFWSTAEPIRDQPTAQADIAEMARRYHADDPEEGERIIRERFQRQERISFRIVVGAVHDSVALPLLGAVTVIENAASEALAVPSLTLITMFEYAPACAAVGVPDRRPVVVLNVAHDGRFWMLYVSVSPVSWSTPQSSRTRRRNRRVTETLEGLLSTSWTAVTAPGGTGSSGGEAGARSGLR